MPYSFIKAWSPANFNKLNKKILNIICDCVTVMSVKRGFLGSFESLNYLISWESTRGLGGVNVTITQSKCQILLSYSYICGVDPLPDHSWCSFLIYGSFTACTNNIKKWRFHQDLPLMSVEVEGSNQCVCVLYICTDYRLPAWTHINICNNELVECLPPRGEQSLLPENKKGVEVENKLLVEGAADY